HSTRRIALLTLCAGLWTCSSEPITQDRHKLSADAGDELPPPDAGPDEEPDAGTDEEPVRNGWPPPRPDYVNPIIEENLKPGDDRWERFTTKSTNGELEGYADRTSVAVGDTFALHVSSSVASKARWQLYRLGWYGGDGARRVAEGRFDATPQPSCPMTQVTGRVHCAWDSVPVAVPADAVAGLYLVKLLRDDGWGSWVPIVVTDDRPADLLFQASVTTWQAYNDWGGA